MHKYRQDKPAGAPKPALFGLKLERLGSVPVILSTDLPLAPRGGVAAGFLRSVEARCGVRVRGGARGPLHGSFMFQVKLGMNTHGGEPVTRKCCNRRA